MKTIRILHSIRSVNPIGGGPIEGLKQMSVVNRQHGHEVEVLCLDKPNDPWVKECPLPCHAMGPSWLGYGYSPRLKSWLNENHHRYDIVIVNGIWQYSSLGIWQVLRKTHTPYFVYTHGMLDPWFKRTYPIKHLKKWLYWPWADYRVLRDAAAVLFTCEEERQLARESFWLYQANECVVNYGTAGPVGDVAVQKELFRQRFPHLAGKRCLLFLGRVHVKKGPDLLFRAFARALLSLPQHLTADVHLLMAGPYDHAYGQQMVALAEQLGLTDRVTWLGMVKGDMKWGCFYQADAFILPSHQENFGISVAEAMACGVPVLISDQVNIWREICNDRAGFVDADTLSGTVNLIERWLQTPRPEWEDMKARAKASYAARFNIEKAATSLVNAWERFGRRRGTDGKS